MYRRCNTIIVTAFLAGILSSTPAFAGLVEQPAEPTHEGVFSQIKWKSGKGITFGSKDGDYQTNIRFRLQSRFSTPFDSDARRVEDFDAQDSTSFDIRRARIKVGGHGYKPWIGYYFEYDWPSSSLLDCGTIFSNPN